MVDYDFLTKGASAKSNRVEFLDIDLPPGEIKNLPDTNSPLKLAKMEMLKGDKLIADMKKEAEEYEGEGEAGLAKLNEMIGQVKTLDGKLESATKKYSDPYYKKYKDIRNVYTPRSTELNEIRAVLQRKLNQVANEVRLERQKEQQKIKEEAAKLQAKIDKEQDELRKKEKEAAKKENREPVRMAPIVVDVPAISQKTKTVTESGSTIIDTELVAKIQNLGSKFILQMVLNYRREKYLDLAEKALKDAVAGGVLGLKGADGVTVTEETVASHRKR